MSDDKITMTIDEAGAWMRWFIITQQPEWVKEVGREAAKEQGKRVYSLFAKWLLTSETFAPLVCPGCKGSGMGAKHVLDLHGKRLACETCDGFGWKGDNNAGSTENGNNAEALQEGSPSNEENKGVFDFID